MYRNQLWISFQMKLIVYLVYVAITCNFMLLPLSGDAVPSIAAEFCLLDEFFGDLR